MAKFWQCLFAWAVAATASPAWADDACYRIPIRGLKILEGQLPAAERPTSYDWRIRPTLTPSAALETTGEAYLDEAALQRWTAWGGPNDQFGNLVFRVPGDTQEVRGRLFLPRSDSKSMTVVRFSVPMDAADKDAREAFYRGKLAYYNHLLGRDIPGAAWFRHEARQAELALHRTPSGATPQPQRFPVRNRGDLSQTYELFSGGRAMSENLQLDRVLPPARQPDEKLVKLDTIEGITVQEIDWQPLTKDLKPKLDPLASLVPADQHVIFFPTFQSAVRVADEADLYGTPVLRLAEPRSENALVAQRYQRQLCLSMTGIGRFLGPQVAKSVALTGSDPFYPVGTDVAVLFEAPQPALLHNLISAQVQMAASKNPQAKPASGEVEGVAYRGFRSPDRQICSYVARLDGTIVVTNSLYQLGRLASVRKGQSKSIASLPEYTFFRNRYRLGEPEEDGLLFLSDATIRRWCGPKWRIADSRRTRDAAVMAEIQATHLDRLVKGTVQSGPVHTDLPLANGELSLTPQGVVSSTLGTLDFLTPIAEVPLTEVTKAEAQAYGQWRDGYQRNWSWAFDPIALRIGFPRGKTMADLTVMPLIANTEFRRFIDISQGTTLAPNAGDPHDALVHFALALNPQSDTVKMAEGLAAMVAQGKAGLGLGWVGSSAAIYADDDPFWQDLAKVSEKDFNKFMEKEFGRLPVAVQIEATNGLKLAAFLVAARAFIDQTAPGMTAWQTLSYQDQPYVKVTPTEKARGQGMPNEMAKLALYYAATGDCLVLTLNENVLKRALDRRVARAKAKDEGKEIALGKPWVGSSVALRVDRKALEFLSRLGRDEWEKTMQIRAWGNLPILTTWKRMYPDHDPVAVHERLWHTELVDPAGGKYAWNEKWQTVESTVYGHPGEPKSGPAAPPILSTFGTGDFGLTFEDKGLRARVVLEKPTEKAPAKTEGK